MNKRKKYYFKHPRFLFSLGDTKYFNDFFKKAIIPRKCKCSFCGKKFHNYRLHGYVSELAEKHKVTLGPRFSDCPYCGSVDKYRWLWYVIENHTNLLESSGRLLHFAPEAPIKDRINQFFSGEYLSGDIVPGRADYIVDMTDICFGDQSFDYIIACNVTEHITEVKRVIKPNGIIILSFPVAFDMVTYEDSSLSKDERIRNFGQEDHVRIYGIDYIKRFESYGFHVQSFLPRELMTKKEIRENGFEKVSPILLLQTM